MRSTHTPVGIVTEPLSVLAVAPATEYTLRTICGAWATLSVRAPTVAVEVTLVDGLVVSVVVVDAIVGSKGGGVTLATAPVRKGDVIAGKFRIERTLGGGRLVGAPVEK